MLYEKQSGFSRTRYNDAKAGAYYTDVPHCRSIASAFLWPDGEVSVLEPSIGNGEAVETVTDAAHNQGVKIFGVEINTTVAAKTKADPLVEECLAADFTNGLIISNNSFGFCFQNPPYLEVADGDEKERAEMVFLKKTTDYLVKGGIQVLVINHRQLTDRKYLRFFLSRYELLFLLPVPLPGI